MKKLKMESNQDSDTIEEVYNKNKQDFYERGLDDEDLEEWFQSEIGETLYVCNLCDKGFEELDNLKKHLIYKHEDAFVVLASSVVRE